jgi:hypothetical protein
MKIVHAVRVADKLRFEKKEEVSARGKDVLLGEISLFGQVEAVELRERC